MPGVGCQLSGPHAGSKLLTQLLPEPMRRPESFRVGDAPPRGASADHVAITLMAIATVAAAAINRARLVVPAALVQTTVASPVLSYVKGNERGGPLG